jgi:hypothetical protein
MLTRSVRGDSTTRQIRNNFFTRIFSDHRLSLRPDDAAIGFAALGFIVLVVLMISVAESFLGQRTAAPRVLLVLILLFAPATLGAVYSLAFEKSKVYGSVDLTLACVLLRMLPFAWYWNRMYGPITCAFTAFCGLIRFLQHRWKR